jgi:hypothetical protein
MQPERRKRFRIMTLKNLGYALIALLVVLAAANVISEMRPARHGEFGRLDLSERQQAVTPKYRPMVVHEGEVPDVTQSGGAVSLDVEQNPATAAAPPTLLQEPTREPAGRIAGATQSPITTRSRVTITGGADGVRVETTATNAAPKLTGGIFRQ